MKRYIPVPFTETESKTEIALLTERSRPSRGLKVGRGRGTASEGRRSNAGKVWADNSEHFPDELKSASRRVNLLKGCGLDHEELCAALAVYARIPDPSGNPHHAIGFTEYVARTFIAKLREDRREEEKKSEAIASVRPDCGLRSIGAILSSEWRHMNGYGPKDAA